MEVLEVNKYSHTWVGMSLVFLWSWSHVGVFYRDKFLQQTSSEAMTQARNKDNLVPLSKGP